MAVCTLGGLSCLDVAQERENARLLGFPLNAWGPRANCLVNPLGPSPARGLVLMLRSSLDSLDRTALHDLVMEDSQKNRATAKNLLIVRAFAATPGYRDDPDAAFWVELADKRHSAQATPLNASYNVKDTAGGSYLSASRNSGADWTWTTMLTSLWTAAAKLGSWPGLPFTPDGTPEGFSYFGWSAYAALNDVLERISCALRWEPSTDTYTIVRVGATDTTASLALTASDKKRLFDAEPIEPARANIPYYCRVHFPVQRITADTTGASPYYVVDVTDPSGTSTGVETGTYALVFDELSAQYDSGGSLTNSAALTNRANERAADYFRRARLGRLERTYTGILSDTALTPGAQLKETAWLHRGNGLVTALGRFPGMDGSPLDYGPDVDGNGAGGGNSYFFDNRLFQNLEQDIYNIYRTGGGGGGGSGGRNFFFRSWQGGNLRLLALLVQNYLSVYGGIGASDGLSKHHFRQSDSTRWYWGGDPPTSTGSDSATLTASNIHAYPFFNGHAVSVDRLGIYALAAGGGTDKVRLGIYTNTSAENLYPNALVVDSGEITITTTGMLTATVSVSLSANTLYWFVIQSSATVSAGLRHFYSNFVWAILGFEDTGFTTGIGYKGARAYAALPDPFTAAIAVQAVNTSALVVPGVAARLA